MRRVIRTADRAVATQIDLRSEQAVGIETAFRQRNSQSAFGTIVCIFDKACANEITGRILHGNLALEIDFGNRSHLATVMDPHKSRRAQTTTDLTHKNNRVSGILEPLRCNVPLVLDQPHHRNGRSGIDHASGTFII